MVKKLPKGKMPKKQGNTGVKTCGRHKMFVDNSGVERENRMGQGVLNIFHRVFNIPGF